LYFLTLGGLFISVGSYFFEREKGFGLTADRKDKGYSRWAKDKEIKEELKCVQIKQKNSKAAGIPIILNEDEMWVDDSEYHSLVIGATGSGKTQGIVFPQVNSLAKARESMIITDPKGEIYEQTSLMLRKRGYQILLLNFRDPQNGNAWNPLSLPYKMYKSGNQDKAIELLDDLALNILTMIQTKMPTHSGKKPQQTTFQEWR
jgi:type IV secretion system protein VirD4